MNQLKENNYKEFIALIHRYEEITLDEIERLWPLSQGAGSVAHALTGFDDKETCTLCKVAYVANDICSTCVWQLATGFSCAGGVNESTYLAIEDSETPDQLFQAFKARAAHMRKVLTNSGI